MPTPDGSRVWPVTSSASRRSSPKGLGAGLAKGPVEAKESARVALTRAGTPAAAATPYVRERTWGARCRAGAGRADPRGHRPRFPRGRSPTTRSVAAWSRSGPTRWTGLGAGRLPAFSEVFPPPGGARFPGETIQGSVDGSRPPPPPFLGILFLPSGSAPALADAGARRGRRWDASLEENSHRGPRKAPRMVEEEEARAAGETPPSGLPACPARLRWTALRAGRSAPARWSG